MSVSTAPGGPPVADPRDVQLNTSRLSHVSTDSAGSAITLGGVDYHVGSRVGKTGAFVIGDPTAYDPHGRSLNSLDTSRGGSNKGLVHATAIEEKGYSFEDWNWPVIRLSCLVLVCAVMIALLAAVIGVSVEHRMFCDSPFEWHQGNTMYHIQIPYFADSDNDDVGDIAGMIDKLDYMEFLGTKIILLSHLLPSDQPYWDSFTSFTGVDPRVGTLSDFDVFVQRAHDESEAKIMLNLSPVYTSATHAWFTDSIKHSTSYSSPHADYYVWRTQPDLSIASESSWTKSIIRNMYYLHGNNSDRPMLNWGSTKLQDDFVAVLDYWLKRGVDGFIIRDMNLTHGAGPQDLHNIVKAWKDKCKEYDTQFNKKILAFENSFLDRLSSSPSVKDTVSKLIDLVIVKVVMGKNDTYSLQEALKHGLTYSQKTSGPWTCWELMGVYGVDMRYVTSLQMYTLMLPGTPMLTAGQEVGNFFRKELIQPQFPPKPMLWKSDNLYPMNPGKPLNETTIKALKALITERNSAHALREDSIYTEDVTEHKKWNYQFGKINKDMMVLERKYLRKTAYYYAGNYNTKDMVVDLSFISAYGNVLTDTANKLHGTVNLQEVKLIKGQGVVFSIIQ